VSSNNINDGGTSDRVGGPSLRHAPHSNAESRESKHSTVQSAGMCPTDPANWGTPSSRLLRVQCARVLSKFLSQRGRVLHSISPLSEILKHAEHFKKSQVSVGLGIARHLEPIVVEP